MFPLQARSDISLFRRIQSALETVKIIARTKIRKSKSNFNDTMIGYRLINISVNFFSLSESL